MNHSRRAVLATLGTATMIGLTGCSNVVPGHVRPSGDPDIVPEALVCEREGFDRHPAGYSAGELTWGQADGFTLRVDERSFDFGATAQISLRNTGLGPTVIGNRDKYNLEVRTQSGWQDVRGAYGTLAYTSEGIEKWPGQGWTWNIQLTEAGIAEATDAAVSVCPALSAGRYRFVYWGVDGAVAVAFDLSRQEPT